MTELDLLNLLIAFVAPTLVGLLTKASFSASVKAILLLALTTAASVVQKIVDAGGSAGFDWKGALMAAGVTFIMAVAVHFGLYKPTGVTDWVQAHGVKDEYDLAR